MNQGWISVYRKLKSHWLYSSKPFDKLHAWLDILLSVNHEPRKFLVDGNLIPIDSGQMFTSLSKLTDNWGWDNRQKTKRFLTLLQNDAMISLNCYSNGTLLSVLNWHLYQSPKPKSVHSRYSTVTPTTINNNVINSNNETINNISPYISSKINSDPDTHILWCSILNTLKSETTPSMIDTWLSDCYISAWDNDTPILSSNNSFKLKIAQDRFGSRISELARILKNP